jgi:hypothetical protein
MNWNAGAGYPLTFRCSRCKVMRDWRNPGDRSGLRYEVTGRTRPLRKKGSVGPRCSNFEAEYRCLDCAHVGWSKHVDVTSRVRRN